MKWMRGAPVGLELGDVDVEGAVEAERRGQQGDALGDEAVQVGVRRALDVEGATADVGNRLVVQQRVHIHVLEQRVHREDRVVGLADCGRDSDLRRRDDGEAELQGLEADIKNLRARGWVSAVSRARTHVLDGKRHGGGKCHNRGLRFDFPPVCTANLDPSLCIPYFCSKKVLLSMYTAQLEAQRSSRHSYLKPSPHHRLMLTDIVYCPSVDRYCSRLDRQS